MVGSRPPGGASRTQAGDAWESRRWQDIRARAIDQNFDADRRRVGERVAVSFRWLFLIVLAVLNNLTSLTSTEARVTVDLMLAGWAAMNVVVNVVLAKGYQPGKQFSLTTMTLDILFATGLVYLSNGFSSPFFLALFLAVITNAIRFGVAASVISALVISFIYLFIGGSFTPANFANDLNTTIGEPFLFLVVALATSYMTRELERERRQAVERAAQADSLRELSMTMVSVTDIKDVFTVVVDHAVQMTGADRGRLVLASQDGFDVAATAGIDQAPEAEQAPLDEERLSQVARTGEAAFAPDRRGLVVPIASGEGLTALLSLTRNEGKFTNQDLFSVDALSGSSAVPLANALRYHRSTREATTDGLTELFNVRELHRRLDGAFARADRRSYPLSLILVDFDHFKSVNDEVGHQRGDVVLQRGAMIVRKAARSLDVVARYGGDELAVMVNDADAAGARRLADRIVAAVHAASVPTTPGHQMTFSVGVATYPEDGLTSVELVAAADQALYFAKREGKDRVCTFAELVRDLERDDERLVETLTVAGAQVVVAVAHAVDHRRPITRGHSSRIAAIAEAVAKRSTLPAAQLEDLRTAAFLHDVGHVGLRPVSSTVLAAASAVPASAPTTLAAAPTLPAPVPNGESQGFELPGHAAAGGLIVAKARFAAEVAASVRHHHERWDGQGLPDGVAGDQIPQVARILAVAETYEALTSGRGCERTTAQVALERVTAGSGSAFDPAIVEALRRTVQDGNVELVPPEQALPLTA